MNANNNNNRNNNMCLFPRLVTNKKYTETKKNGGIIPPIYDNRVLLVPIGCQECIECRKQKCREWRVRLSEDIRTHTNGKMVTLTFSNESIAKLTKKIREKLNGEIWLKENVAAMTKENERELKKLKAKTYGYGLDNQIATYAVRKFLERYRKDNKKSLRHWLVTELGHSGTENIHLHGIVWTDKSLQYIEKKWKYGHMYKGNYILGKYENYVNEKTINYTVKYINKVDKNHQFYKPIILTSAGIGGNYTQRHDAIKNKYKENGETNELYRTRTGLKLAMPIYYKNKIYTEEEKEKLWIEKLDKQERWVLGVKIKVTNGESEYYAALKSAQELNHQLGYGSTEKRWERRQYETERRLIMQKKRLQSART